MKNLTPAKVKTTTRSAGFIGLALVLIGEYLLNNKLMSIGGVVIVFVAVVFHIVLYRCPHCRKFLGRNEGDRCPYCGKKM